MSKSLSELEVLADKLLSVAQEKYTVRDVTNAYFLALLKINDGNRMKSARIADVSIRTLQLNVNKTGKEKGNRPSVSKDRFLQAWDLFSGDIELVAAELGLKSSSVYRKAYTYNVMHRYRNSVSEVTTTSL